MAEDEVGGADRGDGEAAPTVGRALKGEEKTFVKVVKLLESRKVRLRGAGKSGANRGNAVPECRNWQRVTAMQGSRAQLARAKSAQGNAGPTTGACGDGEGA